MKYIIMLLLLSGLCFGQSYYASYDSTAYQLQKQINDSLAVHVKGYDADNYCTVNYDSLTTRYWIDIPENDSREPIRYLTEYQRTFLITRDEAIKQRLINEY